MILETVSQFRDNLIARGTDATTADTLSYVLFHLNDAIRYLDVLEMPWTGFVSNDICSIIDSVNDWVNADNTDNG